MAGDSFNIVRAGKVKECLLKLVVREGIHIRCIVIVSYCKLCKHFCSMAVCLCLSVIYWYWVKRHKLASQNLL